MHDAPFPRLIALLLTGAWRAGKNTCYPDRRRPARVLIGLCEDGGMDREDLRLAVYRAFAETGRAPDARAQCAGRAQRAGRAQGAGQPQGALAASTITV